MKINKLNKTISKGVFLASCFATLSFSSVHAQASFTANGIYDNQNYSDIVETTGFVSAYNGGSLSFTNSTFGAKTNSNFDIVIDNALHTGTSEIHFYDSTVYAKQISMGSNGITRLRIEDTNLNIDHYAFLGNGSVLDAYGSTLTGAIRSNGTGMLSLYSTTFVGYAENLDQILFSGGSHWKSIGSSSVNSIIIDGYVNLEFVMTYAGSTFQANSISGSYDFNSKSINFSDEFIEEIMNGDGFYQVDVLSTIVCPGVYDGAGVYVYSSNETYEWDVTAISTGFWMIDNIRLIAIPEPSTYAMIFGVLALSLAVYRRRK